MAVLTNVQRAEVTRDLQQHESQGLWTGLTKPQLRAAINAADDWLDTNAAAYNLALPLAFRTNATPTQKALVLVLVLTKRFLTGA